MKVNILYIKSTLCYYFDVAGSKFATAARRSLSDISPFENSSFQTLDGVFANGGDLFSAFLMTQDVVGDGF